MDDATIVSVHTCIILKVEMPLVNNRRTAGGFLL
jgi:hypothetical protein